MRWDVKKKKKSGYTRRNIGIIRYGEIDALKMQDALIIDL